MEVNAIVSLILSHQFDAARTMWRKIRAENKHTALRGVGVYFHLKDKKFEDAAKILHGEQDMYSAFLLSQILLADKKPKESLLVLVKNFEASLVACAGYCNLLLRSAISFELTMTETQRLVEAISKSTSVDPSVILTLSKYLEQQDKKDMAVDLLKKTLDACGDTMLQARYLTLLADVDFAAADKM
jgi:hypothetical protein